MTPFRGRDPLVGVAERGLPGGGDTPLALAFPDGTDRASLAIEDAACLGEEDMECLLWEPVSEVLLLVVVVDVGGEDDEVIGICGATTGDAWRPVAAVKEDADIDDDDKEEDDEDILAWESLLLGCGFDGLEMCCWWCRSLEDGKEDNDEDDDCWEDVVFDLGWSLVREGGRGALRDLDGCEEGSGGVGSLSLPLIPLRTEGVWLVPSLDDADGMSFWLQGESTEVSGLEAAGWTGSWEDVVEGWEDCREVGAGPGGVCNDGGLAGLFADWEWFCCDNVKDDGRLPPPPDSVPRPAAPLSLLFPSAAVATTADEDEEFTCLGKAVVLFCLWEPALLSPVAAGGNEEDLSNVVLPPPPSSSPPAALLEMKAAFPVSDTLPPVFAADPAPLPPSASGKYLEATEVLPGRKEVGVKEALDVRKWMYGPKISRARRPMSSCSSEGICGCIQKTCKLQNKTFPVYRILDKIKPYKRWL